MKIYLAARYSRIDELNGYAEQLRSLGHTVDARWLQGNHQIDDAGLSAEAETAERVRFAEEDLHDLMSADACISFTEIPRSTNSRGGRHVEFGAALAAGKLCIVIGPRENVFHCLPEVYWFSSWEEFDKIWLDGFEQPTCRECGCSDDDCSGCVEKTGVACHWVEPDLCSACAGEQRNGA